MSKFFIITIFMLYYLLNIIREVIYEFKKNTIMSKKSLELFEMKVVLFYSLIFILSVSIIILENWKKQKHFTVIKIINIISIFFTCLFIDNFIIQALINTTLMWFVLRMRIFLEFQSKHKILVNYMFIWLICTYINDVLIYINILIPKTVPVCVTSLIVLINILFKVVFNPINIIISKYFNQKNPWFFLVPALIYLLFNLTNLYAIKQLNLNFNLVYTVVILVIYGVSLYWRSKNSLCVTIKMSLLLINLTIITIIIIMMSNSDYLWIAKALLTCINLLVLVYFIILVDKIKYILSFSRPIILFILLVIVFYLSILIIFILLEFSYNYFLIPFIFIVLLQVKYIILLNI